MRAWASPTVPALPGRGPQVRVHDTASGSVRVAAEGPRAHLYVCGITPYDATHLGHAATYLAFDLLHRAWRDAGQEVRYVQNVTDVDDPLLERAAATGTTWRELADRETALFAEDMTALRALPPAEWVGVTEVVDLVADAVVALRERGAAYAVERDVYFPVAADPAFGAVSGLGVAAMRELSAERGGDPDRAGKRDPVDPLLWRAERPGEPAWDSAMGPGRPGWHVECTAIALDRLGEVDVQGGGSDLVFPHHEMSAAHAQVLTGRAFAGSYVHAGMVGLDGAKMSKSLGNLVLVSRLRAEGRDPAAVRLAVLAHHYRSDWDWTADGLAAAEERLARWRAAMSAPGGAPAEPLLERVRAALADDLDAPAALGAVDEWAASGSTSDAVAPGLARGAVDALLGVAV